MKLKYIIAFTSICTGALCSAAYTNIGQAINQRDLDRVKYLIENNLATANDSALVEDFLPILNYALSNYKWLENSSDSAKTATLLAIIKYLLDNNADVNKYSDKDYGNESALHRAVRNNQPEIVTLLLDHGANINAQAGWAFDETNKKMVETKETPLFIATAGGKPELVKILLNRGANTTLENYQGLTPYETTIIFDEDEITTQDRAEVKKIFDEHKIKTGLEKVLEKPKSRDFGVKFE